MGPLGYDRVYLPLCNVADTPFDIQGNDMGSPHPDDPIRALSGSLTAEVGSRMGAGEGGGG